MLGRVLPRLAPLLVLAAALRGSAVLAQAAAPTPTPAPWRWPEKPQNLKVLPREFTGQKLRPVMSGFTRALGVRCTFCHVGTEGKPLETYDFVSDANPNKERAREMYRMLGSINDQLAKIPISGDKRVNMWCHTCHQGRARPTTLAEELDAAYRKSGATAAIARYRELRERYDLRGGYDFSERSLNEFGYELLGRKEQEAAIAILRLNVETFPQSGNAWDSLAEAYLAGGNKVLAETTYGKAIELDPQNSNALEKLRKLRKGD
jgi:tetratricopeptide (TPR) repeat protein